MSNSIAGVKGIEKIKIRIVKSDERGIIHASRADVRKLGEVINILIDKVNELVEENNKLLINGK